MGVGFTKTNRTGLLEPGNDRGVFFGHMVFQEP
jgi:hypothetical protein